MLHFITDEGLLHLSEPTISSHVQGILCSSIVLASILKTLQYLEHVFLNDLESLIPGKTDHLIHILHPPAHQVCFKTEYSGIGQLSSFLFDDVVYLALNTLI